MHRFYLPPEQASGESLRLSGSEGHHALNVLRIGRGETVTVLDGAGHQCLCEVCDCSKDSVELRILERRRAEPPPCQVTLVQALPKGKIIESIIEKATELGVSRVVPILSEHVVSRIDDNEGAKKRLKWQSVAIAAIKQSGSAWLPKVEAPVTPQQFVGGAGQAELSLVASLQQGARHPREFFEAFRTGHRRQPSSVLVWIGPEGDFTAAELELAQSAGAKPISLGPLVLRSETAAIYCLSVINYEVRAPLG